MTTTVIGARDLAIDADASICRLQLFDGPLELSWHHCATTSDFIGDLCVLRVRLPVLQVREVRHSVAYLANELIENAVKFKASGDVGVQAAITDRSFTLTVRNRIGAEAALRLQSLAATLVEGNAGELLIQKIEANAQSGTGESGLGLLTLMSDYGVRLAWTFEAVDRADELCLETCAMLPIGAGDMMSTGGHA